MYTNYRIPNYGINIPRNNFSLNQNRNDRLFGGGFAVPFLLGGITGGLLSRPNNYGSPYPIPAPYPVPYPYYVNSSYPYSYSENYYYY